MHRSCRELRRPVGNPCQACWPMDASHTALSCTRASLHDPAAGKGPHAPMLPALTTPQGTEL